MKKNQILFRTLNTFPFICGISFMIPVMAQTNNNVPSNWISYNRNLESDRYSPLNQINTTNIKQLHLLHTFNLEKDISSLQTGPIVVDGIMYFTTDTMTYAINAATGKLIWKSGRPLKKESQLRVNRGVAFYDNKLFRGSGDGTVFIGNAGGDNVGITGHVYALDAKTGKMLGYNQIVRRDLHDWDVDAAPVLITTQSGRKIVASANKDGLLTVMDRSAVMHGSNEDVSETLQYLYSVPTTIRENVDIPLNRESYTHFKPGILGGSEWNGPAYSPEFNLIYVGTDDWGASGKLLPLDSAKTAPPMGANWLGGLSKFDPPTSAKGWLTAFNVKDGSVKWKFHASSPIIAGVTPTAGGLVFTADEKGIFYAFNAQNGKILWQNSIGLPVGGGVVSYAINGKQYIAIVAGMRAPEWPGAPKKSEVLIYGL